jgi:CotH kinase protein/Lamin Tail Domain/Secretion system C-terminal sorting domain
MKKITTLLLCFSIFFNLSAQDLPESMHLSYDGRRLITGDNPAKGFYDETKVQRVDLTFAQADYWAQMTANYASKTDIPATMTYNGKTYPNVGVRFRGNTSYQRVTTQKKSFSVTMDFQDPQQDVNGYETLHFNNAFEDASMMREVLYLSFNRRHIPAAKGSFINLFINGQSWGLYPNIQALNGQFMKEWFLSNNGTRWRAERAGGVGGPGGFGAGTSTLNFLGTDTATYKPNYTLKNTEKVNPWTDLVKACEALNTPVEDDLKKVFDTDRALWFVAHEIIFGDDDSYVNKGGQDYYVFWDKETNRITPIEYDGNSAFNSIAAQWSPFLKEASAQFPIMNKLFKVPALRQRYLAHVRTIIEESMDDAYMNGKIDTYFNLMDQHVKDDPKKLGTYDQFVAARNTLKTWLANRKTFLKNNLEVNRSYPFISDVNHASGGKLLIAPDENQKATVTAKISNTNNLNNVFLYYATGLDGYFNKIEMFDEGKNGDGAANDGIFGGDIPAFGKGTYVRYYIEAINNDADKTVSYMPKGAEHDVYIYQVKLGDSANKNIVINEVMASNTKTATDPKGQFDDWIELYNKSTAAVDISGWFISDNPNNRDKWKFPQGTTMPANGYLIVWADEDSSQNTATSFHTNFKLSAAGETILLFDKDTLKVDEVTFGAQKADVSYARKPNGTGNFGFFSPTYNATNDSAISPTVEIPETAVKIYPNPTNTEGVNVSVSLPTELRLQIFNMLGQVVYDKKMKEQAFIETQNWSRGVYVVKVGNVSKKLVVH